MAEDNVSAGNLYSCILKVSEESSRVGSGVGSISQRYGSAPKCHGSPSLEKIRASNPLGQHLV
jgi:hypothetical protein